ncbi:MAG TPA: hypothetical protein QGF63_04590, partial [Alphaproteobacteria bacterium]|nr:hypothetical protein [Alphaproteobacteria bacterium]
GFQDVALGGGDEVCDLVSGGFVEDALGRGGGDQGKRSLAGDVRSVSRPASNARASTFGVRARPSITTEKPMKFRVSAGAAIRSACLADDLRNIGRSGRI